MSPRQGGDSYPSGTPPYGVPSDPAFSRAGQTPQPGQPGQSAPGDEPRTETTLTTRIKINIPGSRPIPPVVVRSPLTGEEAGEQPAPRRHRAAEGSGSPVLGVMDSGTGTATPPELPAEWRTPSAAAPTAPAEPAPSEWFAPRKKQPPTPGAPAEPAQEQPPQEGPFQQQSSREQGREQGRTPRAPHDSQSPWTPPQQQPRQSQQQPVRTTAAPQTLAPRPVPGGGRPAGLNDGPAASDPTAGAQPTLQFRAVTEQQAAAASAPAAPAHPHRAQPAPKAPRATRPAKSAKASAAEQTAAMPAVPPTRAAADGFAGGTGGAGAPPRPEPSAGGSSGSATTAPAASTKAGGGRSSKLAGYAVGALVLAGGVAYGAGLMLNQADVPKGTTVLGYSIGGDTRDQAVTALDSTLGAIAKHPLTISVGGRTTTLNPSVAGLTIDTGATVDNVAQHSYNPVTVIGSLFGGAKAVAPVVSIDEEKLRSALQQLASSTGTESGSIRFTAAGKAVITLPKAGSGINVDAAVPLIEQAFRARAAGRPDAVITLTMTTVQPKVTAAATDTAAQTLGGWAMKQPFKVVAGSAHVVFGKNTFSQALTLRPDASGAFVPVFNLSKLSAAYGTAFAGAHTKDGKAVTAQEVAAALTTLLTKPNGPTSITI